jgi:hypothetical protein
MMTPEQALQILSDALQPSMQGRITRAGYVAIEQAIKILTETIQSKPDHDAES